MKAKQTPTTHDAAFKGFMTQVDSAKDILIFAYQSISNRYVISVC